LLIEAQIYKSFYPLKSSVLKYWLNFRAVEALTVDGPVFVKTRNKYVLVVLLSIEKDKRGVRHIP